MNSLVLPQRLPSVFFLAGVLAGAACSRTGETNELKVRDLTGTHTRVVWVQGDGSDPRTRTANLRLMGFDTDDGRGERAILSKRRNYTKPLLTPRGDRIVFTNRRALDLHVVNWDGTGLRRLAEGFGLAVWQDPETGVEWVYAARDPVEGGYRRIVRFPINHPESTELVWDKTLVGEEFQLSADGRLAASLFPWPNVGIAELPNGSLRKLGDGCWPALAPLDPPLFWYFDGSHRNLTIINTAKDDERRHVSINKVPGFDGAEVYFPRWTNHALFLTIAGPYNLGTANDNQALLWGRQAEIYLGRFSADLTLVEQWARVTSNDRGDSYPDVWIDTGRMRAVRAAAPPSAPLGGSTAAGADARAHRVVVDVRLTAPVAIPSPRDILPYRHAMAVHHYDVVRVVEGSYGERTMPVAHWVVRDGRILSDARRAVGTVYRVTVEPYASHPELEGERLVMSGDEPALPIYYDLSPNERARAPR